MLPADVYTETVAALSDLGIARVHDDRVLFLDSGEPMRPFTMPPSLRHSGAVWEGLEYLRLNQPRVALLLTMHMNADDFKRLALHTGHILETSPVCGVEASGMEGEPEGAVPRPRPYVTNEALRSFQLAQFAWLEARGALMLPSEPVWSGRIATRLAEMDDLFELFIGGSAPHFSPEVQRALLYPVHTYRAIYRAWGLVGQFGYWLSHARVQERLKDFTGHIPFVLGAAHTLEHGIFQELLGADVKAVIVDRKITEEEYPGAFAALMYLFRYQEAMRWCGMPASDLGTEVPFV